MKKIILIALVGCLFACAKATEDTGRALNNANEVVTEGGPKVWRGDKVWDNGEKKSCGCASCEKGGTCSKEKGSSCGSGSCSAK